MSITLDGTNGITTPDVTSTGLTADTTTLVVDDVNDRVGIGTSSPSAKLDVLGSGDGDVRIRAGSDTALIFSETTANKNWKLKPSAGDFFWQYSSTAYNSGYSSLMALTSSGNLLVGTTNSYGGSYKIQAGNGTAAAGMYLNSNGSGAWIYGIDSVNYPSAGWVVGHVTTTARLQVRCGSSGGVELNSGATSWSSLSDERLKDIIEPITNAAQKVSSLRSVIGKYKTDEDGVRRSFLIAQDVQNVLPEAVSTTKASKEDDTDYLSVAYTDTIPLLVAAIKEQQAIIEEQKTALEAQQQAIAGLTARVEALEGAQP